LDYAERSFAAIEPGRLNLIASKAGREESLPIHQDADVYVAKLAGGAIEHELKDGRAGWVQVIEGDLTVNGQTLHPGDGAAIDGEQSIKLESAAYSHWLLFDLKN
jgi:quercetin 2,3-dioxygenase